MKIAIAVALLYLSLNLVANVSGHDWLMNGREAPPNIKDNTWSPFNRYCSDIVNGQYSSYVQRLTSELGDDRPGATGTQEDWTLRWGVYGEHCTTCDHRKIGDISTLPPSCNEASEVDRQQFVTMSLGNNCAETVDNRCAPGAFSAFDFACSAQLIRDRPIEVQPADCKEKECFQGGQYTAGMSWAFNAQNAVFYSCTDWEVLKANGSLNPNFFQALLANAWWIFPAALLPVVLAAVYARRHKAESQRLSMASRDSAITAAPATGYRSGFTNVGGGRDIDATTAAPATGYRSGFSGMSSSGASAKTAASAKSYKSGRTGKADLDDAAVAPDAARYTGGFTQFSDSSK